MDTGDILACSLSGLHLGDDRIEMHRRGIHHLGIGRRSLNDLLGNKRPGIEADRAALDQLETAHGDKVGGTRAGSDKIDGHSAAPFNSAANFMALPSLRA